jgi:hypothetical protein
MTFSLSSIDSKPIGMTLTIAAQLVTRARREIVASSL